MVTTARGCEALEPETTVYPNERVNKWAVVYSCCKYTATKEYSIAIHSGTDGSYYHHEVVPEPSLISCSMLFDPAGGHEEAFWDAGNVQFLKT